MMRTLIVWSLILACGAPAIVAQADSWGEKRPIFSPNLPKRKAEKKRLGPSQEGSPLEPNDILIGFKFGAQFTSYTDILQDGRSSVLPNGTGYLAGGAVVWNVGLPRLEMNILVDTRQQGSRQPIPYIGVPAFAKFCITENRLMSWEAGAGIQIDSAIGGGGSRRAVLVGMPVATDLIVDFRGLGVHGVFELRYLFGLTTYEAGTTGGRPRDFGMMAGILFPIDRTGF